MVDWDRVWEEASSSAMVRKKREKSFATIMDKRLVTGTSVRSIMTEMFAPKRIGAPASGALDDDPDADAEPDVASDKWKFTKESLQLWGDKEFELLQERAMSKADAKAIGVLRPEDVPRDLTFAQYGGWDRHIQEVRGGQGEKFDGELEEAENNPKYKKVKQEEEQNLSEEEKLAAAEMRRRYFIDVKTGEHQNEIVRYRDAATFSWLDVFQADISVRGTATYNPDPGDTRQGAIRVVVELVDMRDIQSGDVTKMWGSTADEHRGEPYPLAATTIPMDRGSRPFNFSVPFSAMDPAAARSFRVALDGAFSFLRKETDPPDQRKRTIVVNIYALDDGDGAPALGADGKPSFEATKYQTLLGTHTFQIEYIWPDLERERARYEKRATEQANHYLPVLPDDASSEEKAQREAEASRLEAEAVAMVQAATPRGDLRIAVPHLAYVFSDMSANTTLQPIPGHGGNLDELSVLNYRRLEQDLKGLAGSLEALWNFGKPKETREKYLAWLRVTCDVLALWRSEYDGNDDKDRKDDVSSRRDDPSRPELGRRSLADKMQDFSDNPQVLALDAYRAKMNAAYDQDSAFLAKLDQVAAYVVEASAYYLQKNPDKVGDIDFVNCYNRAVRWLNKRSGRNEPTLEHDFDAQFRLEEKEARKALEVGLKRERSG